jgi:hypothetical protein
MTLDALDVYSRSVVTGIDHGLTNYVACVAEFLPKCITPSSPFWGQHIEMTHLY